MIAELKGAKPMEVHIASNLDDARWHRLSMQISEDQKLIRVEVSAPKKSLEILYNQRLPAVLRKCTCRMEGTNHAILPFYPLFSAPIIMRSCN